MIVSPRNNWMIDAVQPVDWMCPLNRGLLAWYLGLPGWTGGRRFIDITSPGPNGKHGTLTNMDPVTAWVPSPRGGRALDLDGVDDYVTFGNPALDFTGIFSALTSFRLDNTVDASQDENALWDKDQSWGLWFVLDAGKLRFGTYGGNLQSTRSTWPAGQWYQVVVTFGAADGSDTRMYVDGALDNSGDIGDTIAANSNVLTLGRPVSGYDHFDGQIDDSRIWNRVLLPSEVKAIYLDSLQGYPRMLRRIGQSVFPAAVAAGTVMNQFQGSNLGADLFNGTLIA